MVNSSKYSNFGKLRPIIKAGFGLIDVPMIFLI